MYPILVFLIIPANIVIYSILATQFGVFQTHPLIQYAIMLGAVVWLVLLLRKKPSILRGFLAIAGVLVAAGFVWWLEGFAKYSPRVSPVGVGQDLTTTFTRATVELDGEPRPVSEFLSSADRGTLLVFYRGHW